MRCLRIYTVSLMVLLILVAGCTPGAKDKAGAPPKWSPDHRHLLGLQNGMFTLTRFPGNDLVRTFPTEEKHLVRGFQWAPRSDAFAYHTEHVEPGGSGGVFLVRLDGSTEEVATLEPPNVGTRQMLYSPSGRVAVCQS